MTAHRFSTYPPLASADTWAGRQARREISRRFVDAMRRDAEEAAAEREAQIEAIWHDNKARRDAAAAQYGEPSDPHDFFHFRPGEKAERIVCDCLRALQALLALPDIDRLYADKLSHVIAREYLTTAPDTTTYSRRLMQLLKISGGKA